MKHPFIEACIRAIRDYPLGIATGHVSDVSTDAFAPGQVKGPPHQYAGKVFMFGAWRIAIQRNDGKDITE